MARKKPPQAAEFLFFDVLYQDGARSSNRKVATADIDGDDDEAAAQAIIEAQDRDIAAMSGNPRGPIKSISRSAKR